MHWAAWAAPDKVKALINGSIAYTAQLSLAASYGLLQVTYVTARDQSAVGGQWKGNDALCDAPGLLDPDNLFDTECNLQHKGGSLGIGTRMTQRNFIHKNGQSPAVTSEASLEKLFSAAYQKYNLGRSDYGQLVLTQTQSVEPLASSSIF